MVWRRTVMPSSRRMVWNVDRAPWCFGRVVVLVVVVRCEGRGSVTELTWSCSRILMTSRGAMQNLEYEVLDPERVVRMDAVDVP